MDNKERQLIDNYKKMFLNNSFTEYDMYGFLIIIRRHIYKIKSYELIIEFCDLVAHRTRDRGMIMKAICQMSEKKKNIKFIDNIEWKKEWRMLSRKLKLNLTDRNIDEITMCIYSLCQNTVYNNKKNPEYARKHIGYVKLIVDINNNICLGITAGRKKSKFRGFAKYKNCIDGINNDKIFLDDFILVRNEQGHLCCLMDNQEK